MTNVVTLNGGANMTDKMKRLQSAVTEIQELKKDRSELNASIQAVRERFAAMGVPKAAADMAMRYFEWDVEKRQGFDTAYALMREVIGLPLQGDLFTAATNLAKDVEEKKEAAKPTAKDIADRKFEQVTRGNKKSDEPPAAPKGPDAAGIAKHMEGEKNGE